MAPMADSSLGSMARCSNNRSAKIVVSACPAARRTLVLRRSSVPVGPELQMDAFLRQINAAVNIRLFAESSFLEFCS